MKWTCSKCGVDMEEVFDVKITYGTTDLPDAPGFRCPQCGVEFLGEEYVTSELNASEQMMEGK